MNPQLFLKVYQSKSIHHLQCPTMALNEIGCRKNVKNGDQGDSSKNAEMETQIDKKEVLAKVRMVVVALVISNSYVLYTFVIILKLKFTLCDGLNR